MRQWLYFKYQKECHSEDNDSCFRRIQKNVLSVSLREHTFTLVFLYHQNRVYYSILWVHVQSRFKYQEEPSTVVLEKNSSRNVKFVTHSTRDIRPSLLAPSPSPHPGSQLVYPGPGPQFVFPVLSPPFVFLSTGLSYVLCYFMIYYLYTNRFVAKDVLTNLVKTAELGFGG